MNPNVEIVLKYAKQMFEKLVDCSDSKDEDKNNSRYLAAFSLMRKAGVTKEVAAHAITDGFQDLGIDAFLFDQSTKKAWIVQSKLKKDGSGSPDEGDILKLKQGIEKLISDDYSESNEKLKSKKQEIDAFYESTDSTLNILITVTTNTLPPNLIDSLKAFAKQENASQEWIFIHELLIESLKEEVTNAKRTQIDLNIGLTNIGEFDDPYHVVYGKVNTSEVSEWFETYDKNLFIENIRQYLGTVSVNERIVETLEGMPQNFFYMNNGITILADTVDKTRKFGTRNKEQGEYKCSNVRIINGAQTVGSIADYLTKNPNPAVEASVFIKIIDLRRCPTGFKNLITVASNTQNQIDAMDFASLDNIQLRLEREFLKEFDLTYLRMRGVSGNYDPKTTIEIEDLAMALIAQSTQTKLVSNYKREKTKFFWRDITVSPYTDIFNDTLQIKKCRNIHFIYSLVKEVLEGKRQGSKDKKLIGFTKSADLFIAHCVFHSFTNVHEYIAQNADKIKADTQLKSRVEKVFDTIHGLYKSTKELQQGRIFIDHERLEKFKELFLKTLSPY